MPRANDEVDRIVDAWKTQRPDLDFSPLEVLSRVDRLSRQGPVLNDRVTLQTPQLQVSLAQFEQVFTEDGQSSQGRILLQAVLLNGRAVVDQKRILVTAPAPTQDAEGGVAALREATDLASDQLAQWLGATLAAPAQTARAR